MADLADRLGMIAVVNMCETRKAPAQRQVRIGGDRALMQPQRLFRPMIDEAAHMAGDSQSTSILRIEQDCALRQAPRALDAGGGGRHPTLADRKHMPLRGPGMRRCI